MAGRPASRAKAEAEAERIREARALPSERRNTPEPYSPALCNEMIALARIGLDFTEIADHWSWSEERFEAERKAHTEFDEASSRARASAKAWWIRQARVALASGDSKFAAGAWAQAMRRYPEFDDRRGGVTVNVSTDGLVILDLSHSPRERMGLDAKSLDSRDSVQLEGSYTVVTDGKSSLSEDAETLAPATDAGRAGEA